MRFGWLAAAAAMAVESSAQAATVITQSFSSSFQRVGSSGAQPIGGLNLVNQVITSAVVSYTAGAFYSQDIVSLNPNDPGTLTFSGTTGFQIFGPGTFPVPAFVASSFSGTSPCVNGRCVGSGGISGDYIVPEADLAFFARSTPVQIAALGGTTGSVSVAGGGVLLQARETGTFAGGRITFLIADIAVPEPATWAMMLIGFGAVGFAMRRRRQVRATVAST